MLFGHHAMSRAVAHAENLFGMTGRLILATMVRWRLSGLPSCKTREDQGSGMRSAAWNGQYLERNH